MIKRVAIGFERYGWRTPFFMLAEATRPARALAQGLRRTRLRLFAQGSIHPSVRIEEDVFVSPRGKLRIDEDVFIGRRATLEIAALSGAGIEIGARTWISHDCHMSCSTRITIAPDVLIGEFCSIRDTTHKHEAGPTVSFREQGDSTGPITIESGVWVGRGVLILAPPEGLTIGRDSIIAANSVVRGNVPPCTIWGGAPARKLRDRV